MNRQRNKQSSSSSLDGPATKTMLWNAQAQPMPCMHNTLKKDNKIHRFIQSSNLTTVLTSNTSAFQGYARSFTFSDLVQATSFQTIFDQYRITDLEVWLIPGYTNSSSFTPGVSGQLYTVTDYDDDTTPSSSNNLLQYTNVMQGPPILGHYRRWKPHVAEALYGGGAFTSYGNIPAPWIDMSSSSVKHYGFKAGVDPAGSSGSVVSYGLNIRIHFECRNVF